MTIVISTVKTLSGIPEQKLLEQAASILLKPFLSFGIRVHKGPVLSKDTGLEPLYDFMSNRHNFSARGRKNFEALFNWSQFSRAYPPLTGSLSTYIKYDAVEVDVLLEALIKTSVLLMAPMSFLDLQENGFRQRSNIHRDIYQEGKSGIDRVFDDFRGLSGIPWKTVFGPDYVEYFGVEKFRKLPSNLAAEIEENYWLLSPCEDYQDWSPEVWCEGEAEIIETLGKEHFFNPEIKALATKGPLVPEHSSLPIKIQTITEDKPEKEWVYLNGYPKPE